jgi:branched-subunit amino acid transport protein
MAAAAAAFTAWRTRQLWVAIAVGMAVFWLLRIPF